MSTVHASFQVDLETKKYADGLTRIKDLTKGAASRMVADMAATEKATERLGTSVDRAGRKLHAMGNMSHQIQDVAVQLQAGTKAATIFAQQGSQIASTLGPQGAVLGAVIAIGAGIYTWATGAAAANKQFEESEKRLKSAQDASANLRAGASADTSSARMAGMKGPALAQAKLELDHEKEMFDIRQRGLISGDKAMESIAENAEMARYEAEKAVIAEEAKGDRLKRYAAESREIAALQERARDAEEKKSELSMTDAQKLLKVEKEIAAIHNRTRLDPSKSHDNRLREAQSIASLREKELEAEQIKKRIQEEGAKEARSLLEDSIKTAEKVQEIRGKLSEAQQEMSQARAAQAISRSAASGESILDQASEFRKSPSQRAADRQEAKDQTQAERRNEGDILDKADRFSRRHGGSGLTQEERQKRVAEMRADVNAARNKNKVQAEINDDSIEKLAKKIESLQEALIEK